MILSKVLFVQLLFALSTSRIAVALPVRVNHFNGLHNKPTSQSAKSTNTEAQTRPGGFIWKLAPYLGATSLLAMIGGLVYFGTRQEETHNEALEAHKKEQLREFVESGVWEKPPDLAESVTSGERRAIVEAGKADRDKVEKLKEMKGKLNKEIKEIETDILLAYHNKVKKVQENHVKGEV